MSQSATLFRNIYRVENDRLLVEVLGRDTEGNRVDRILTGTQPYFYVLEEDGPRALTIPGVIGVEPGPPTIGGRKTVRVKVRFPFDVPKVKGNFAWHGEADILYSIRERVDHGLTHAEFPDADGPIPVSLVRPLPGPPPVIPRQLYLDIETNDLGGFGRPDNAFQPMLSVAFYDSYRHSFGVIWWGAGLDHYDGTLEVLTQKVIARIREYLPKHVAFDYPLRLFPVPNEMAMLGGFGELLSKVEPDYIGAWNGYEYDYPYMSQRAARMLPSDPGSEDLRRVFDSFDIDRPKERYHGGQRNKGRYALLDHLVCYKKLKMKQGSNSLEAVAQDVLGFGKIPRPDSVTELRQKDLVGFLAYTLVDVLLDFLVDEKKGLTGFFRGQAEAANIEVQDVPFNSRIVDGALLTEVRVSGAPEYALPSKEFAPRYQRTGRAAVVFDPVVGRFLAVGALDLSGSYPSIEDTLNISPETRGAEGVPAHRLVYDGRPGGVYRKFPPGILPRAIRRLRGWRVTEKAKAKSSPVGSQARKDAEGLATGLKYVVNSFTGVLGSSDWRLGSVEMFEDVTGIAREQLKWNRAHIEDSAWLKNLLGESVLAHVIMGDTDSCYFWFEYDGEPPIPITDPEVVFRFLLKIRDALNTSYAEFFAQFGADTHHTEVEIEGVFAPLRTLPLKGTDDEGAKKRYYGLYAFLGEKDVRNEPFESRVKYVGIEVKRYNNAPETIAAQKKVIEMDLTLHPAADVVAYVDAEREAILKGERDELLPIPTKLSKEEGLYGRSTRRRKDAETGEMVRETIEVEKPPFVRAIVNYSLLTGRVVTPGDDFRWFYTRGTVSFRDKSEPYREFAIPLRMALDEARAAGFAFDIDRERMVQKVLDGPVEGIYPEVSGSTGNMETEW